MEMAQALKPLGVRSITGAELTLDDGTHLTLLCQTRDGLPEPLPPDHSRPLADAALGARGLVGAGGPGHPGPAPGPGPARRRAERDAGRRGAPRRGARLPVGLRPRRRGGRAHRARRPPRGRGGGPAPAGRVRARPLPRRAPAPLLAPRPPPQPLLAELAERLGVPCVATGNVHVALPRARPRSRTRSWRCGCGATLDETEPSGAATPPTCWRRPSGWRRASADHPEAVAETGRLAERLDFDLTERPRLPLPRLGGSRRRPQAGRAVLGTARRALPAQRRDGEARPARGGAARDPPPRPVGLLPAPPRHARAGARGRRARCAARDGAAAAAARARPRLERVSSIVCYLTGLSHIDPIENELLPRALPQRGDHGAARHRPRLPARHPRGADPARARPLRPRPLRARGGVRDLPVRTA